MRAEKYKFYRVLCDCFINRAYITGDIDTPVAGKCPMKRVVIEKRVKWIFAK